MFAHLFMEFEELCLMVFKVVEELLMFVLFSYFLLHFHLMLNFLHSLSLKIIFILINPGTHLILVQYNLWPVLLNNFQMIIFNGMNYSKDNLNYEKKLLFTYFSWVPAIFTRNYEIYVSNYCWIHNVRKEEKKPTINNMNISFH